MTLDAATEAFVVHRDLLFTVVHELLGSAADTEDVLQETWLRLAHLDVDLVRDRRAELVRIAVRQALARLRQDGQLDDVRPGSWLPEAFLSAYDDDEGGALSDTATSRLLLALQSLTPIDRAVFLLGVVFGLADDEIARVVDQDTSAVRRIARRARAEVAAHRPQSLASPAESRAALEGLRLAIETGDVGGLLDVLACDAVAVTDGGGSEEGSVGPIVGAEEVGRYVATTAKEAGAEVSTDPVRINGHPALVVVADGIVHGVAALGLEGGTVTGLYYARSPEAVAALRPSTELNQMVHSA